MIGATLNNYRILEKIGEGGQGAVYKAVDAKLGRTVVVKVLPPELTVKEANLKRFEREAKLASSLDHPNICTIFDMGEANNIHYIAMQFVEGRNVRQLVNGRPLELRSALTIAIQVTDALTAAHARGIIHRDIKAGNVMVTSTGQVKVLDFGLAKLLDEDEASAAGIHRTELTEIGVPYGTATYAAPEQARGDRVDHRADIFSTGVLLYEMLTGMWPFHGKTSIDVRHAVLHDNPKPLAEARPGGVPPGLQEILDKAIAKDPRDRYQKISELRDELRRVLQEVSAGASQGDHFMDSVMPIAPRHAASASPVSRALRWLRNKTSADQRTTPPGSSQQTSQPRELHETPMTSVGDREKKSVAILPFKNIGSDTEASFYEFSLADAVITELAQLRSLVVRPSSLVAKYQGKPDDPREIGRELNVSAVLAASFLKAGERFRVTAQLLDVESGGILWSDKIDVAAGDIITIQDTIVQRIVSGLRLELSPDEEGQLAKRPTENAEAYEEYLRARDCFGRYIFRTLAREDCDQAIERFQNAIHLDTTFALAYSGLGACYANRVFKGFGDAEDYERAEDAFSEALALDPELVEARMLMVFIYLSRGEKRKARDEVARLRRKAPNEGSVYFVKATLHRLDGEYERALRAWDKLSRLDPAAVVVASYNRARIFVYQGRYEEALKEIERGSEVESDHPLIKTFHARILYYQGQFEEARSLLRDVLEHNPGLEGIRPIYAMCLSKLGEHEAARAELSERVLEIADADHDIAYWTASAYALEGEREEAFRWLERAIDLGNENRAWFESDTNWSELRADERFQELMLKTGASKQAAK
jgi:serine/threonine protein kinase/tetratricopeptide (TPR) repeat protein